jgi:hypothetical protein
MKNLSLLILSLILLCACSNNHKKSELTALSPMQAIEYSAASAPESYEGVFEMTVKAGNLRERLVFLNSEVDYRDQRNLTVVLRPMALEELTKKYGKDPLEHLLNKKIMVKGEAKRMKIWMFYKNKKINKYYYQTHVFVNSADQISVL